MPTLLEPAAIPSPALEPYPPARPRLSRSSSLLLDAVRFGAALAVLLHHFTDSHLSTGFPHLGILGHEAVCIFFVLSGFVIRLVTVTRASTFRAYTVDRASRIYSVVLPALAATVICEALARAIHPAAYAGMRDAFAWSDVPPQLVRNLSFTAQLWGYGLNPLSNAPFWSLSYEVLYYALYGVMHYRVRGRWFIFTAGLLLAGPSIALLFPVWLLGVATCDLYLYLSRLTRTAPPGDTVHHDLSSRILAPRPHALRPSSVPPSAVLLSGFFLAAITLTFTALRHPITHLLRAIGHENRAVWLTAHVVPHLPWRATHPTLFLDPAGHLPWLTEASLSFAFIGLFTAAAMLFGLLFLDRYAPNLPARFARITRTVADSTFTLYLFHVPLMLLAVVCIGHPIRSNLGATLLLAGLVLIAIPLARLLDHFKDSLRATLHPKA